MKRTPLFLCLLFFLILTAPAYAQENVSLRLGDRGDFARLVFGWGSAASYERTDDGNAITVKFDKPANAKASGLSGVKYIESVRITSNDPLTIQIVTANGAKIRDFKIGKRIILDIYKPPGFSAEKVKTASSDDKPATKDKAEKKSAEKKKENVPAVPPAPVSSVEKLESLAHVTELKPKKKKEPKKNAQQKKTAPKAEKPKLNKEIKKAVNKNEHIISVRATNSLNIAVFENRGRLWFALNTDSDYIAPEINTHKPGLFSEVRKEDIGSAKAYSVQLPKKALPKKAMGGGLVWNIVFGSHLKPAKHIKPVREQGENGVKMIWPMKDVGRIIKAKDPVTGQDMRIVTVNSAKQFSGEKQSYVDFDVLASPVGMVILPKVDDLVVKKGEKGVEVYRKSGLSLARAKLVESAQIYAKREKEKKGKKATGKKGDAKKTGKAKVGFFNFKEWMLDTAAEELPHKKTVILSTLHGKSDAAQIEDLLTLGKMYLSYGRGAEALGFFDYAQAELPELEESAEFRALRGVAKAIDWKSEAAMADLSHPQLKEQDEVKYWKSYALADLGDWQQAAQNLPKGFSQIYNYPHDISGRLGLPLAEVALRDGRVKDAEELMTLVEHHKGHLLAPLKAYLSYLKGEAARQKGKTDKAKKIWKKLSEDPDDLYRTKAKLALTILKSNEGEIDHKEMVDSLERLRYAWRGDELEANVKYWLGRAYFKKNKHLKGLHTMRDGAGIVAGSVLGDRIANEMSRAFTDLFLKDHLEGVSPLEAVALYEEFSELTPLGEDGNKLVQELAEHLVKADLLPRAAKILRYQVNHRLQGEDKTRVAIRLAVLELMDKDPQGAVNALSKATNELKRISNEDTKKKYIRQIALLKTRAYLQNNQFDKALSLLNDIPEGDDVHRLRADITWRAGYWGDAADAIRTIMIEDEITGDKPLTNEEADFVMNRAIALSLDNDRFALSSLRQKYIDAMKETYKARQFEVITRPRKDGTLADKETLLSVVSEVDMFKDFMDAYRQGKDLPAANDGKALHQ